METKELVKEQIDLFYDINRAGLNIVTCGNCGTMLLHKIDEKETITCFSCKEVMAKSDCPDYWFDGAENNTL